LTIDANPQNLETLEIIQLRGGTVSVSDARPPRKIKSADFDSAIAQFGRDLGPRMRGDGRREDRLRVPVHDLIKRVGKLYGFTLHIHDEVTLTDLRSRPDIAVDAPIGRIGYVELKAPGKRTPVDWQPSTEDRKQWEKLKVLPNLIYCDGSTWALFRHGTLVGRSGCLSGDLASAGERLKPADGALQQLFHDFLHWRPQVPRSLRRVVAEIAPLCRLLREQVSETLQVETTVDPKKRHFTRLANEWRTILFPVTLDEEPEMDFADAYAQAVTFALLLARVDGIAFEGRSSAGIAEQLTKQHSLLGETLAILANSRWVAHLNVVDTLLTIIGNIDWSQIPAPGDDTHAELYESFLADYDPELRQRSGTYYTPTKVARAMVRLVDDILRSRLNKKRGFAARDVVTIDPAMGAGTFLVEVLNKADETVRRERRSTTQSAAHLRELFEHRLIGFELQAAPFAVTELRLHALLKNEYKVEIPREEPRFLTDTLDNPDAIPINYGILYDVLRDAVERANRIKRDVPVTVVIGNPPWRENAKGKAPWLEERRDPRKVPNRAARPSMDEFRPADKGRLAYNLSNMWTYFWRWSAWKAFEANEPAGVVALISPSAYLTSAAYAGMRRYLREVADEGWVIDLSPEQHRPDPTTRIFPTTQHRICIGIFLRSTHPQKDKAALIHYTEASGTRDEKEATLENLSLNSPTWRRCSDDWEKAFRPEHGPWEDYPPLGDLMPWQQTGVNSNRNWVWAPSQEILADRWKRLVYANKAEKRELFKETRDRVIHEKYPARPGVPSGECTIATERTTLPNVVRVGFRSFDRQFLINDRRAIDFHRPELWQTDGPRQIYVCEQHAHPVDNGPALSFSALVPNVHYFDNRGGRAIPLRRSATDLSALNIARGLLAKLSRFVGIKVTGEDFLAYLAGTVAHPGFTARFREELRTPGVRVPITLDRELWTQAVRLGREVIWLHTYGERFVDDSAGRPFGPPQQFFATYEDPVPAGEDELPDDYRYEPETETLHVGSGRVRPVSPEVWHYRVGNMAVVGKWLDYRRLRPRHRKVTSPLDKINASRWTSEFDDELLELLEVLRRCVALEPDQREVLERICAGPVVTVQDLRREGVLPVPSAARKPPKLDHTLF
jgi:hypothetical protein